MGVPAGQVNLRGRLPRSASDVLEPMLQLAYINVISDEFKMVAVCLMEVTASLSNYYEWRDGKLTFLLLQIIACGSIF